MDKLQKDLLALALEESVINLEDNSEVYYEYVFRIEQFPSAATPTVTKGQNFKHMQRNDSSMKKALLCKFWVSHQRFFKCLCFAVKLAREALETGKCSVICLQPNGEVRTLDQLEKGGGELNDFVSTATGVLLSLIEKYFPYVDEKLNLNLLSLDSPGESTFSSRKRKPVKGAKLGRKRCIVSDEEYIHAVSDSEGTDDDTENEKDSSSGSDSQESDYNPFADSQESDYNPFADSQESDYNPFADSQESDYNPFADSQESDYNPFADSLESDYNPFADSQESDYNPFADSQENSQESDYNPFADSQESDYNPFADSQESAEVRLALTVDALFDESLDKYNLNKFMNKILGLPVKLQNTLFQYFTDALDAVNKQAKKACRYDLGILHLRNGCDLGRRIKLNSFLQTHATGTAETQLHTIFVERGFSWEKDVEKCSDCHDRDQGFYFSWQFRNRRGTTILAVYTGETNNDECKLIEIYRPDTGLQAKANVVKKTLKIIGKNTMVNRTPFVVLCTRQASVLNKLCLEPAKWVCGNENARFYVDLSCQYRLKLRASYLTIRILRIYKWCNGNLKSQLESSEYGINLEDGSEVYREDAIRIGQFPSAATPTVKKGQNFKHMQHSVRNPPVSYVLVIYRSTGSSSGGMWYQCRRCSSYRAVSISCYPNS
ncbi:protein strawberry notch [Caerostris extrusa]|uniref:Protein strawberry notch n=1 Tax=Caerostris extrusa TaxID=172846 RepID=A0AAV4Y2P8_CAEEX|nr:protein strawberry notch [Caerostris extrusa]